MVRILKRGVFSIYSADHEYIVHNTHKEFSKGHTHIKNFQTAKYLVKMSLAKKIPYHASIYVYDSLIRLAEDQTYIQQLRKKKKKV